MMKLTDAKPGDRIRVSFEIEVTETPAGYLPYVEGGPLQFTLTAEESKSVVVEPVQ